MSAPTPSPQSTVDSIRSLRAAFDEPAVSAPVLQPARPLRKVFFDLPPPLGRFQVLYHDVVRQDMTLALVYDHNRPLQMVWFPPAAETEQGLPAPLAALVFGQGGQPDMAYLVYPTGLHFTYEGKEFCLLSIEKEKVMKEGQAT